MYAPYRWHRLPRQDFMLNPPALFDIREQIGEDLAWMHFIGQPIDHRYARTGGETLQFGLLKGADHDQIDHAGNDARRIFNRFSAAQLRIAHIHTYSMSAELGNARLE